MLHRQDEALGILTRLIYSQDERIALKAVTWLLDNMLSLTAMKRLLEADAIQAPSRPRVLIELLDGDEEPGEADPDE